MVQLSLVKTAGLRPYLRGDDDDDDGGGGDDDEMTTISDTSTSLTTEGTPAD